MIRKLSRWLPVGLVAAGFALLGPAHQARAILVLATQTPTGTLITVDNNDAGGGPLMMGQAITIGGKMGTVVLDENPILKQIGIGGVTPVVFGGFEVTANVDTSRSPLIAPADLTSSSTRVKNVGGVAATNTVMISDTDYQVPGGGPALVTNGSHVNGGFTTESASGLIGPTTGIVNDHFLDTSNTLFGMGTSIQHFAFNPDTDPVTGNVSYNNDVSKVVPVPGPYSYTIMFALTLDPGDVITSRGNTISARAQAVPEPATVGLLLSAVPALGLGAWLRRRGRRSA